MNLKELQIEVHALAVEKGWHDNERSVPELLCLVHSEVSEALEAYRVRGLESWHRDDGKPEGVASELADVVIRLLDMSEHCDVELSVLGVVIGTQLRENMTVPEMLCVIHDHICDIPWVTFGNEFTGTMCVAWSHVFIVAKYLNIDLASAILEKHEYNKTRPYRHGGKRA